MKTIKTGSIAEYSEISDVSEFVSDIRVAKAPIVVLFTNSLTELSAADIEILKNCAALTVIAGDNLSAIPNDILAKFDLRITETPTPITNAEGIDNFTCAAVCGENSAYQYSRGGDISNDFFTILSGEGDFHAKTMQYLESLSKDKDDFQLYSLAACFRAARSGSTEAVFAQESMQFYRLMQRKSKEASNGIS